MGALRQRRGRPDLAGGAGPAAGPGAGHRPRLCRVRGRPGRRGVPGGAVYPPGGGGLPAGRGLSGSHPAGGRDGLSLRAQQPHRPDQPPAPAAAGAGALPAGRGAVGGGRVLWGFSGRPGRPHPERGAGRGRPAAAESLHQAVRDGRGAAGLRPVCRPRPAGKAAGGGAALGGLHPGPGRGAGRPERDRVCAGRPGPDRGPAARLAAGLAALGCQVLPGEANYLLFQCGTPLAEPLRRRGILLRSCANYQGLGPDWYRAAVRTGPENRRLLAALREVLG